MLWKPATVRCADQLAEVVKNDTYNRYPYSAEDFTVSDADLVKWLRDLGAGEIIDNKEEQQ